MTELFGGVTRSAGEPDRARRVETPTEERPMTRQWTYGLMMLAALHGAVAVATSAMTILF